MELSVFITKKTDAVFSEMFGIPKRTVASWRRLERAPSTLKALEIIEKTEGVVDWDGIYQPYAKFRARKQAKNR